MPSVTHTDDGRMIETTFSGTQIIWQDVPRSQTGGVLIGETPESLLPVIIDRLRWLNHEPNTSCRETSLAITHCEEAMHWLQARRTRRDTQGVTGTYQTHSESDPPAQGESDVV